MPGAFINAYWGTRGPFDLRSSTFVTERGGEILFTTRTGSAEGAFVCAPFGFATDFASTTLFDFAGTFVFFVLTVMDALNSFSNFFSIVFLRHFIGDILLETLSHTLKRDALENGIEESLYDNFLCFGLWDPARLQIEEGFRFKFANRRTMRTADIVRENFQTGDGIGSRTFAQYQIPVGLITICFLRARSNIDHALPNGATLAFQGALE